MAFRSVPQESREAVESLGATGAKSCSARCCRWQAHHRARINQTIMGRTGDGDDRRPLIAASGLGQVVIQALSTQDVGTAFNAGLAIVLWPSSWTGPPRAASERVETQQRKSTAPSKFRRPAIPIGAVVPRSPIWLSYTYQLGRALPVITTARVGPHSPRCRHAHRQRRERP